MATSDVVPDDCSIYRGLRNASWSKSGKITWKAFILRPAGPEFPAEEELSFGMTQENAVDELNEHFGWAKVLVGEIHTLPHSLIVRPNAETDQKADLFGLPLHSDDPDKIDDARSKATDLAVISQYLPPC